MDRDRIVAFSKRSQQVLLLAGATGAVTGLAVAGFDKLTVRLLHGVLALPVAAQALMPAVGLFFAAIFLRYGGAGASPATSDVYIRAFHDRGRRMEQRPVLARVAAAIATLGSGAPLGYEGPSLYLGAAIGTRIQRRFGRLFSPEDAKVLLVAGAAAGVAAIFKAPVTGMVFALEVPYQRDIAHRMLLPAAISAAASYVVFAALAGTEPLLPIAGQPPFNFVDLGGAAAVGLAAGLLARAFAAVMKMAKKLSTTGRPAVRIAGAGAVLASTVLGGHLIAHAPLSLGPGYNALRWALAPERSVFAIVALGTLRVAGTAAAVSGGGSGGLFIPLVIQGALIGRVVGGLFDSGNGSGGMAVPPVLYLIVAGRGAGSGGWGVPIATDIAFAIGVVALLGSRVPASLKLFLLTLAVVDDIGAIVVIALFYAAEVQPVFLLAAVALVAVLMGLRRSGIVWIAPYVVLGIGVWLTTQASGIHATIAGVALGLLTPARALTPAAVARAWAGDLADDPSPAELEAMTRLARTSVSPAERLEHLLHPWTTFVVIPLFALANAGISVNARSFEAPGAAAVTAGVMLGLVAGKALGITGGAWLAVRSGLGKLPEGATWPMVAGIGVVGGIGFTVSLFVSELAFGAGPLQDAAKIGVLGASTIAAVLGALALARACRPVDDPQPS